MLGEPAPSQGDIHFNLFGIPIRIHPFFWVIAVLLGAQGNDVTGIIIWVMAVFIGILIHELGHALVIKFYGHHPWIVLYGMGGLTCHDPAGNYRTKANTTFGQIFISAAGPFAGFLLVAAIVAVLFMSGHRNEIEWGKIFIVVPFPIWNNPTSIGILINYLTTISILWGFLNLLPIYPLDGGQIAREFLLYINPNNGIRQSLILSIATAILAIVFAAFVLQSMYSCLFFALFAYENYTTLQNYSRGGRW